jgi:hypothetical protein
MKRSVLLALAVGAVLSLVPGCLIVETKEYHITLKNGQSGKARIVFNDIQSESDDTVDVTQSDFQQLIDLYLHGSQFERDNPGYKNVEKRLFEKEGKLVGEVSLSFDSLSVMRLYQYDNEGPLMYFVGSPLSSEVMVETNGTYGRDWMPIVFWPSGTTELYIKTRVVSQGSYHRSLLPHFKAWEQSPQAKEKNEKEN